MVVINGGIIGGQGEKGIFNFVLLLVYLFSHSQIIYVFI